MSFYPVFLSLVGQPVLLVGAGGIALQKLHALLDAGARVHVVAPEADPQIQAWAGQEKLFWSKRPYQPSDMEGVKLVIAATDDQALQPLIAHEARRRGLWVNVVDVPPLCDFIAPSILRRGDIQIAISTGGAAPALSKYLRQRLEALLGPEFEQFALLARRVRPELMKLPKDKRMSIWDELVSESFFDLLRTQGSEKAEAKIFDWIKTHAAS